MTSATWDKLKKKKFPRADPIALAKGADAICSLLDIFLS